MLFIRSFINLIVVPVVALCIFYKRYKKELKPNFEALLIYAMMIACNIPVTRCFTFIVRKVLGMDIEADSSYYTVAALFAAALMPAIYDLGKKVYQALSEDNTENEAK